MAWSNGPLVLYHGTNSHALPAAPVVANQAFAFTIGWTHCRVGTDFSLGFYVTTNSHQASQWASSSVRRLAAARAVAIVISFEVDRDELGRFDTLVFVRESPEFYDFVSCCRKQRNGPVDAPPTPGRMGPTSVYDVVFGPVSVGRQKLIIQGSDQVSFHSEAGFRCLTRRRATLFDRAGAGTRFLP